MTNKLFSAMIYDMMGWDLDCRYKMQGYKITHEDETMYIFDLLEPEIYMDTKRKRKKADSVQKADANDIPAELTKEQMEEQQKEEIAVKVERKLNRIPFYPKEWKDSFGLPVKEHERALETNLKEGYVEFSTTM